MSEIADAIMDLADNYEFLYTIPRKAIEEALIEMRDSDMHLPSRNNGLVIENRDGTPSDVIRLGPEQAMSIGLKAIANHLYKEGI